MLNRMICVGNLVEEPALSYTPNGNATCKLRIAVTRTFNRDESDFFNIVTWRKTAENCANYLKKGSQVCVEGRLQTRSYEDNEGKKRWVTEIVADNVHFLGGGKGKQDNQGQSEPAGNTAAGDWESLGREIKPGDLDMFDGGQDESEIPF